MPELLRRPALNGYGLVTRRSAEDVLDTGVTGIPTTTVAALLGL